MVFACCPPGVAFAIPAHFTNGTVGVCVVVDNAVQTLM